ncbi:fungal Zn(2)-cys(6) binuclear cluster domain protein, putative [Rhizoctonia solani AG-3 Rhs1AP]|uniref:Fungal Zn(2)-cys(6) binuclear cluster domain protein, putative n=1 Tax=Rhizoctonia solani AG-3 Rhs1AP TaxID=1086054 RepID=X8JVC1_9AGAM|nr:fungal Zn(2)-cys(6) binuclear cluster domain protein, putative [Rhizoctonia solani AG-3 Rhs1AP]
MARVISKPGPPPKSCLTCRRRRKKCDLSKPSCKRCLKGGYECLGYGDIAESRAKIRQEGPSAPIASQALSISAPNPVKMVRSKSTGNHSHALESDSIVEERQDLTSTARAYDPRPSILSAAVVPRLAGPTSLTNVDVTADSSEDFDRLWSRGPSQSAVYSRSLTYQSPRAGQFRGTLSSVKPVINDLSRAINALCQSIPPSVDATQMVREDHFGRVMHEYDLQRSNYWFMSPPPTSRRPLLAQLKLSKGMIWTIYLEVRHFQALVRIPQTPGPPIQRYIGWIDKLEEKFTTASPNNASLRDIADRLTVQLELAFLNFIMVDSASGYRLLRKALPRFLQIVAADSNLYMELPNGNLVVSFPRILSAPRYELRRFALYDVITPFVLGVPPFVEYVYDGECDSISHGLEWIHGIPVLLLQVLSQVNSWRTSSRIALGDWEDLERRVLTWQPSCDMLTEDSATESVYAARVALQEGWRHVVLIYIYMGLCGASSHDSRVQASVHRIIQLGETVAKMSIGVHLFSHCVVAGLAARLEKHRLLVNEMLLSFKDTRLWLFQGPHFSRVLYHLWHGVGAEGAPVKWDDYVRSRCAVIPI